MIPDFVHKYVWQLGLSGVVMLVGVGSCVVRDASIENRGGDKRQAKIEKATDNASKLGKRAASSSAAPGVRGQRDPTTRDD